ncbi:hypothetical protein LCGC14_2041650 [marine sediment metagenome]|uniref:Uncharacterized protein n=1 Tax=marine sediment metagenome TaxID=412755 RepID=A0A0F9ES07_9ZZZZ
MTEWWEFTKTVIIPLVFGAYAFAAGGYVMNWMCQRTTARNLTKIADDARKGRKDLWDAYTELKENELHDLDKRIIQLERDTEKG